MVDHVTMLRRPGVRLRLPPLRVARVGFLGNTNASSPNFEAFRQGLRELGWVEGQNLVMEARWAEGRFERPWRVKNPEEIPNLIALVRQMNVGRKLTVAMESSGIPLPGSFVLAQSFADSGNTTGSGIICARPFFT